MATTRDISVRVKLEGVDTFKRGMSTINATLTQTNSWFETMKGILASKVIQQGFEWIKQGLTDCFDASVEFEDAMIGVAKTTDMSQVALTYMGNQLMDLSEEIPMTATELANLAEIAGQLGIAKDDIVEFVEVVAAMGVSTDLSAEQAAVAFARIANVMGESSDDYSRMGSVIVDLGNKFATTESEITNMAYNMVGAGALVGMTTPELMAFAATLSSIGIEAQAGGSSMQRLFQLFEKAAASSSGAKELAEAMGITEDAFRSLWESDPAGAILQLMQSLKQVQDSGGSVLNKLGSLGISDIRMVRTVTGLVNASDMLAKALGIANTAWKKNTALSTEAEKRYASLASRIQISKNAVTNLETELGDMFSGKVVSVMEIAGNIILNIRKNMSEIDVSGAIDKALSSVTEKKADVEETMAYVGQLIDRLEELGDIDTLDISGQTEYLAILRVLATLVPDLGNYFNTTTGEIEGGTEALRKNAQAWQTAKNAAIDMEAATEAADAYSIGLENQAKRQEELVLLTAQYNDVLQKKNALLAESGTLQIDDNYNAYLQKQAELQGELVELTEQYAEAQAELNEILKDPEVSDADKQTAIAQYNNKLRGLKSSIENVNDEIEGTNAEIEKLDKWIEEHGSDGIVNIWGDASNKVNGYNLELGQLVEQMVDLQGEIDENNAELERNKEVVEQLEEAAAQYSNALNELFGSDVELTPDTSTAIIQLQELDTYLDEVLAEYDELYEKNSEKVDSMFSGFEKKELPEGDKIGDYEEGLNSQLKYIEEYRDNLATVLEKGIDKDILAQLLENPESAAGTLKTLAGATDEEIAEINAKYQEVQQAKDLLAADLTSAQMELNGTIDASWRRRTSWWANATYPESYTALVRRAYRGL